MTTNELDELLISQGFTFGWVLSDDKLVYWEHEQDPPVPLKRPE